MALVDRYANFDLATGANDGTTEANAWQSWSDVYSGLTAGIRVNIKKQSTPYQINSAANEVIFDMDGITSPPTAINPIVFSGYESVTGDGGMWKAEIDTGGILNFRFNDASHCSFENLHVKSLPSTNLATISFLNPNGQLHNCSLIGSSINVSGSSIRCYFGISSIGTASRVAVGGVSVRSDNVDCVYEFIKGNLGSNELVFTDNFSSGRSFTNCIFIARDIKAIIGLNFTRMNAGEGGEVNQCRFYGFDEAINVLEEPDAATEIINIKNSVFENCLVGVNRTNTELGFVKIQNCYYYNITSGFTNYSAFAQINNTPLTASSFTDPSNGNLLLNTTAGGGQVIRDAGGSIDPFGTFETASEFFGTMFAESSGSSQLPVTKTFFG